MVLLPRHRVRATGRAEGDPVGALVEADTRVLTSRLRELALETGTADPDALVDRLLVVYNGALASLLRGAPADPVVHARAVAELVVPA